MTIRRLPFAAAVLLLGLSAVPNAAADVEVKDLGLLGCSTSAWDAQGDGSDEPWTVCATAQCGCDCPYVGAGVVVEAAGRQDGAFVHASCQSGFGTTTGPADGG